nr:nitronate monooxygenase [Coralloluteibacterium stylophorae]
MLGTAHPLIQAPMAGAQDAALAIAVARAGGLGSLPCAMLDAVQVEAQVDAFRAAVHAPLNLNFFCHPEPSRDPTREAAWMERLRPWYREWGVDADAAVSGGGRRAFDAEACALVERLRPEVVSFHFGLPEPRLLERVRAAGARVLGSATTVAEARWLVAHGCDAVIAQGSEAGGHRGMFLATDPAAQVGTFALVPQVVDAVDVPVVAAGGIGDARGIAAAFALGADGVQLGTAYLFCPEATIAPLHRAALRRADDAGTALTNVFSGRPARGLINRAMRELGPLSAIAPEFPLAGTALAPLRAKAEAAGSADFQPLWAGQAAALGREESAEALTRCLAAEAQARLAR